MPERMNQTSNRNNFGIVYCPEYASYFAYDKNKKTSKVQWFHYGIRVKYSKIELLSDPIQWNGKLIEYQIILDENE